MMYEGMKIPYSGKFSLVQIFAEKRPESSEEIFAVFIFNIALLQTAEDRMVCFVCSMGLLFRMGRCSIVLTPHGHQCVVMTGTRVRLL